MALALCCMSHSPLLNVPGPSAELLEDVEGALSTARDFVEGYDPELVVIFSPDHYNGFFYKMMPAFCIGTSATGVGDYGTQTGPLDVWRYLIAAQPRTAPGGTRPAAHHPLGWACPDRPQNGVSRQSRHTG